MGLCASKEQMEFQKKRRIASRTMHSKKLTTPRSEKEIQMEEFMQLFNDYQKDGKDYLTRGQMKDLLQKLFLKHGAYNSAEELSNIDKIIDAFVKRIDINNDGYITKEEVYKFYKKN